MNKSQNLIKLCTECSTNDLGKIPDVVIKRNIKKNISKKNNK